MDSGWPRTTNFPRNLASGRGKSDETISSHTFHYVRCKVNYDFSQLSRNVSVALTTQEIIDRKIENKVNALEEAVLLIGQEITNLKIKLSLRCHAEFKWMCVTPLQVSDSIHSWECIRSHILGVWNHSDFSIDISKLYQDIQSMKQVESDFSSQ